MPHFALAGPEDEAELRTLLRGQPLPGWVTLSFEREPGFFAAAAIEGERHRVLVAREEQGGPVIGFCSRISRRVFVDGMPRWLGYLGQFRIQPAWQRGTRTYRLLREGFAEVADRMRDADELPFDITSILTDNHGARRILTADLPGLPRYRRLSGFNTLVWRGSNRVSGEHQVASGETVELAAIAECLQRNYRRYSFAPVWDEASLTHAGLAASDFLVLHELGRVTACLSIWNQQAVKQTVVRGYRSPLNVLRPLVNIMGPLFGLPKLPRVGEPLRQGWLAHFACDDDSQRAAQILLRAALRRGGELGLEQLMLGLADGHPLLPAVKAVQRHLSYRSDIYSVHWPATTFESVCGERAVPHLELATL